jgi:arsenite-transporting ATPase
MPIERRIAQIAGPIVRRTIGMPMPGDPVFSAGEELFRKLEHMRELLADPERTSVRVVLNLEKMVIKESQRSFTYFHLYGYPVDLVVCNRVLPEGTGDYFRAWRESQQRYRPLVDDSFAPVPVRTVPFFDQEVVGMAMLRRVGEELFGSDDPTTFFFRGRPYEVSREDGEMVLSLELPFTAKEDVKLSRHADELVLQVGSWRRNLILPRILAEAPTKSAKFERDRLQIRFAAKPRTKGGPTDA